MTPTSHQFQLLTQRRFLPFFLVQFSSAFNDNLFKTALLIHVTLTLSPQFPQKANILNNIAAAAFIFPFFLFSAQAGQLADKYDKRNLVWLIKGIELFTALLIGVGFFLGHLSFLFVILFLLGMEAAFFSPIKYSILPHYLLPTELMGGNGLTQMGTFVAILSGTVIGGILMSQPQSAPWTVPTAVCIVSLIGWLASLTMPPYLKPFSPINIRLAWEPFLLTYRTLRKAYRAPFLFGIMISISWFWFYGSILVTQIPNYTKLFLGGSPMTMTALFTIGTLGIGIGSLCCEKLSCYRTALSLVPVGAIGLAIFGSDLSFAHPSSLPDPMPLTDFLTHRFAWRIFMDLFCIGWFGGLYIVPLYVLLQSRSPSIDRSQYIAANSILNAFFMTLASLCAVLLLQHAFSIPELFLATALLHILVTVSLYLFYPEFLTSLRKRIRKTHL